MVPLSPLEAPWPRPAPPHPDQARPPIINKPRSVLIRVYPEAPGGAGRGGYSGRWGAMTREGNMCGDPDGMKGGEWEALRRTARQDAHSVVNVMGSLESCY